MVSYIQENRGVAAPSGPKPKDHFGLAIFVSKALPDFNRKGKNDTQIHERLLLVPQS